MKLTPSSTARCTTRTAVGTSDGGPQMPGPVMRIAPKPSRFTSRSPPSVIWPAALALAVEVMARHLRELDRLKTAGTATLQAGAYIEHGLCPSDGRINWMPRPRPHLTADLRDVERERRYTLSTWTTSMSSSSVRESLHLPWHAHSPREAERF